MTPHHFHALAAAHSLDAALAQLVELARNEAARNVWAEQLPAAPILHAPTYGTRHATGSHADPVSGTLTVDDSPGRDVTWNTRLATAEWRIRGIARMLRIDSPRPLGRMIEMIPRVLPGTAAVLARHLADEDAILRSREWLDLPPARRHLVDIACPVCGERALYVQTAGPENAWTVVCTGSRRDGQHNPCLCLGAPNTRLPDAEREPGCPCGMDRRVEGVAHIWRRDDVLRAVAGAAPTQTNRED